VVSGFLLLLGLVWPAEDSEAIVGGSGWPVPNPAFMVSGSGWSTVGSNETSYKGAVRDAASHWGSESEFAPRFVSNSTVNDITWGYKAQWRMERV